MPERDTIFALSSGALPAAIAVMRITGPDAKRAVEQLVGPVPPPRHAALRAIRRDGDILDSGLVLFFPGPRSATGEDLVELQLHGSRAVVAAVSEALVSVAGLRPARAGEFTRRAFENGRIDIVAAEGLGDLLAAETETQRRVALGMVAGGLSARVERWRGSILQASAQVEAALDFGDEDDVVPWPGQGAALAALAADITAALTDPPAERLRDGFKIAIVGPPNAGKSTLLNALVDRDAAITSPIAGTTRDIIEVPVQIDGIPLIFLDTAGLRSAPGDPIEAIGIARAEAALASADLVLALGPVALSVPHVLQISARCDCDPPRDGAELNVSAHTGAGMAVLRATIVERAVALLPRADAIAANLRQRRCMAMACADLEKASATDDLLIVAEHLRHARLALDELLGRTGVEDMLDALFARFCIGK
ncbi:MAG: tRNA uridine-5-carboxymethylaminomethyl(34) synthesis GTPase MnmE [Sphingomonadaceae bacterium]